MLEITTTICFTTPCLGAQFARDDTAPAAYLMPRTPDGAVLFMPQWWRAILGYGAKLHNGPVALVKRIEWRPAVAGVPSVFRRFTATTATSRRRYITHEAFRKGDRVGVDCVLPDGLDTAEGVAQFRLYLSVAGQYRGISPYKPGEWGRFDVVDIGPKDHPALPPSVDALTST